MTNICVRGWVFSKKTDSGSMAAGLWNYDVNVKFVRVYLFSTDEQYYSVIVASLT